jgi:hypothetical protein
MNFYSAGIPEKGLAVPFPLPVIVFQFSKTKTFDVPAHGRAMH